MPRKAASPPSNMGRRRRAAQNKPSGNYTARREELLKAAADVFQSKGFQGVRMDDIAEQIGVDRATLYYYFGNKQQLFRDVIMGAVRANVDAATEIADGDGSAPEKMRALIVSLFESYDRHYPLLYVYVQEDMRRLPTDDPRQSAPLIELGLRYDEAVKSVIQQGIDDGDFADGMRASLAAYAIIGATNWSHRWFSPDGDLSGQEVGEQFADLFLEGLLAPTARRRHSVRRRRAQS